MRTRAKSSGKHATQSSLYIVKNTKILINKGGIAATAGSSIGWGEALVLPAPRIWLSGDPSLDTLPILGIQINEHVTGLNLATSRRCCRRQDKQGVITMWEVVEDLNQMPVMNQRNQRWVITPTNIKPTSSRSISSL